MRILALETTDLSGSVAALVGDRLAATRRLDSTMRSAQSLAPGIAEVLSAVGWRPGDVQLVAVATGPGSFTGLRVGVTTAKMFAYAVGAEVLGVNTLEVIDWQAPSDIHDLWGVLDAQRNQVFAGQFSRKSGATRQWRGHTMLLDNEVWLAEVAAGQFVSGPGLSKLVDKLPPETSVVDRGLWGPTAAAVGTLAWRQFQAGRRDDVRHLVPQYFRRSAAEEKLAARTAAAK